jgi:hypothetical protein
MAADNGMVWCDGCGLEITWSPIVRGKRKYCCQDCASGLPCDCGARLELDDERREGSAIPGQTAGYS